jgi:hypothetical protein
LPIAARAIYAVAADGTDALPAVDDGHYSVKGSTFAVRTILARAIRRGTRAARKKLAPHRGW